MKKILLTTAITATAFAGFAQKDVARYKEKSDELRQEMWSNPIAEFKVTEAPKELENESAVILAHSFEIVNSMKRKFKFTGFSVGAPNRIFYRTVLHQRIKINDKNALDQYSSIEYHKKLDNSIKYGFTSIYDKMDTYIGSKIIKPGGKEIIVNTEEEVLTKNENNSKRSKLAISDLQVGDILDYYIIIEQMQETGSVEQGPYTFQMNGEYPILYYDIRFQLDEKAGVKYISANGAPAFKESKTEEGDLVLELKLKNLSKYESSTWTLPYRQYPYIIMKYKMATLSRDATIYTSGKVETGSMVDKLVKQYKDRLTEPIHQIELKSNTGFQSIGGRRKHKKIPQDSLLKALYNGWRYDMFCDFPTEKINVSKEINYVQANSLTESIYMSRELKFLNIPHDVVLVCSRQGNSLQNSFTVNDMEAMLRVRVNNKDYWMAFDNVTTNFNEIPVRFEGEDAITLHGEFEKKWFLYKEGKMKIPVSSAAENVVTENMAISFIQGNMQQLKFDRACALTGTYQSGEQKRLLLIENIESVLAKSMKQKPFTERLAEYKSYRSMVPEFVAAFAKEKTDWKNYFNDEIKEQFEEEPKEVTAFEIKSDGLLKPEFAYSSSFTMDNFVKKAGNNYILDAGLLIGKYPGLEEKERSRNIDIYMYSARTFNYNINVAIPEGYTVKGVEDLGMNVKNDAGTFFSKAETDGQVLKITVSRTFTSNYEPAAAWSKLVELVDAVNDFNVKKVLLEKRK